MTLRSPSCLLVVLVVVMVQVLWEPAALAQCTAPMDPCTTTLDCSGCDAVQGGKIPDPEDCHGYYVCVNDSDFLPLPGQCDEGEAFDPTTLQCNATAECFTCPQECVFECSDPSAPPSVSSRSDCNEYYECTADVPGDPIHCPAETPFYDGEDCQTEETRCCLCQPSCDGVSNYVIDPLDCRKYWICSGSPQILQGSGRCDDGEVFDTTLQGCSASATCVTTCLNVVNTTGCIDPFMCLETGYFAMCPKLCVKEYYDCDDSSDTNKYQEPTNCPTGTVFRPDNHLCVNPSDCPYPEPESLRVAH